MSEVLGFKVTDDIARLALMFYGPLGKKAIQRALANSIAAELRAAQRWHRAKAKETHSVNKEHTKQGIRISRPNLSRGKIMGHLYASSRPLSLMDFYKSRGPVTVHVKARKQLPGAFVAVKQGKRSSSDADSMGIFEREKEKDFPTKGRWEGYLVKRGKNKGKYMQRARITKLHTASIGPIFNASAPELLKSIDLPKRFEEYIMKEMVKQGKEAGY